MYVIGKECIACGRCFKNCPVECIYPGEEKYEIRQEACVGCGTCQSVCPIGAVVEKAQP